MHVSTQVFFAKRMHVLRLNLYFLKECMFWAKFWKWIHRIMGSGRKFWRWIFRIHELDLTIARIILKIHFQNFRPDPVGPLPESGPEHAFFYRIISYNTCILLTIFTVSKHAFFFHGDFRQKTCIPLNIFCSLNSYVPFTNTVL